MNLEQQQSHDFFERTLRNRAIIAIVAIVITIMNRALDPFVQTEEGQFFVQLIGISAGACALLYMLLSVPPALRELRRRREAAKCAQEDREQVRHLFRMTDMLQSANGYSDASAVLGATIESLLHGFGGALYVFNNSRDRLELSMSWHWPGEEGLRKTISLGQCWALKRGKIHLNGNTPGTLRCEHHVSDVTVLEIPMVAHGEIQGMLKVAPLGDTIAAELERIEPIATAIADAMSLAVSNIALREKLRTQALRDPLTGLYNRRYMEDALDRYAGLAERSGTHLSAIMIDLDHFKRLNDQFGHAVGDAVLRETAATIMGGLRSSDIACRYGGEELLVILPECDVAEAVERAELLRVRIEMLSGSFDTSISASFGVAAIPETARTTTELLSAADAALYQAKEAGRNRVATTPTGAKPALARAAA